MLLSSTSKPISPSELADDTQPADQAGEHVGVFSFLGEDATTEGTVQGPPVSLDLEGRVLRPRVAFQTFLLGCELPKHYRTHIK